MAAATDLLQEVGLPGTATTLSAPGYTTGNPSITVGSTSGWPTATGTTFAIDRAEVVNGVEVRIEGTYCEFVGKVDSGTQVTEVSKVFGTDQDYSAGALTRVYIPVSSERENRIVEWGLTHADQDGTLKAGAVDSAAVLASDVVETAKIKDLNVTTAKVANGAVTPAKQGTGGLIQLGINSKTTLGTVIPNTYTTYCTVTATATGGTVQLDYRAKIRDGSSGSARTGEVRVQMDGSTVANTTVFWKTPVADSHADISVLLTHAPSAGSHTWTLQVLANTTSASLLDQATLKVDEIKP